MSKAKIDPIDDIETIETELMLADLESLEKRVVSSREESQGRRQGGEGTSRSRCSAASPCCARASPRGSSSVSAEEESALRGSRAALVEARALCLQCRGSVGGRRQCAFRDRRCARGRGRRGCGRRLGQDRKRDRGAAGRTSRRTISKPSASRSRASIASSARAMSCCISSPISPWARRKRAPGPSRKAQGAAGGRRDPHRFRKGLHPRRDHRL